MMYSRKSCYCKCAFSVILEYPKYTPLFKIRFMGEYKRIHLDFVAALDNDLHRWHNGS
jgi:hypothetical protein